MKYLSPSLLASITIQLIIFLVSAIASSAQSEITTLQPGLAIEREIKGGEVHPYRVTPFLRRLTLSNELPTEPRIF